MAQEIPVLGCAAAGMILATLLPRYWRSRGREPQFIDDYLWLTMACKLLKPRIAGLDG